MIYLDYNATTPIDTAVREAMLPYLSIWYGNPSSLHEQGQACASAIQQARAQVAALLGADLSQVVFTSGGTESNNLAILGTMCREPATSARHLVISSLEHPATVEPARFLERQGYAVSIVGCDSSGTVDPDDVAAALRPNTALVSIMHANNEIGSIQPIRAIAELCHARGVLVHTDAAQTAGKISVRVDDLSVDFLSLAAHKFYAPKGIGALYIRAGTPPLSPVLHGAGHERGIRPGTENVASIVGLGIAANLAAKSIHHAAHDAPHVEREGDFQTIQKLRDRLQTALAAAIGERFTVNAATANRLPNTLSGNFLGISGVELLNNVPTVAASTGSACHRGETIRSPTLAAIGLDAAAARGTVRLSLGRYTTREEIDEAAERLIAAWKNLHRS